MDHNIIIQRLDAIDKKLQQHLLASKEILNFQEFCNFCGISESYGYKLTSMRMVPHFKPGGKMVYFRRSEIEEWLLRNPISTKDQLNEEAARLIFNRNRRKT